jgi:hypothetical protein
VRWRGVPQPAGAGRRALHRLATFHFVCFAWVFFRADSFGNAWAVLGRLFTAWGRSSPGVTSGVLLAIAVGIGLQYVPWRAWGTAMAGFSRAPALAQGVVLAILLMAVNTMGPRGVAPFIYFKF